MANRTVQILGLGYGANPAEITVTANGNTVFSGTINTVNQPVPVLPDASLKNSTVVLCSFEIDQAFTGQIPMTCTVNSGIVVFAQILANYSYVNNPVYTLEQSEIIGNSATPMADKIAIFTPLANPPLSQAEIDELLDPNLSLRRYNAILAAHGLNQGVSSGANNFGNIDTTDPRSGVVIDGVAQNPDRTDLPGTWFWMLNSGSAMSYNLEVEPAAL
jgi:hypothetical protein